MSDTKPLAGLTPEQVEGIREAYTKMGNAVAECGRVLAETLGGHLVDTFRSALVAMQVPIEPENADVPAAAEPGRVQP